MKGNMQSVDELLLELGEKLNAHPAPHFETKVMARVGKMAPAGPQWAWRWGFLAGAVATVVLLAVLVRLKSDRPAAPAGDVNASSTVLAPLVLAPVVLAPGHPPVASAFEPAVTTTTKPRQVRATPATGVSPDMPRVLIAPDQASAVRSLLNRFASGMVPSASLTSDGNESTSLQIEELAPIPPIVITPLDAPPNAGSAGSRQ